MCGICGIFEYGSGERVDPELLVRMTRVLAHRGPDDQGCLVRAECGLGVRRLSIIDVASGHQPIANEEDSSWIVFNGEIYNYRELRKELLRSGHRFRTRSDTEVVLHLYEEDPTGFVPRLDGMFAFGIYDAAPRGPGRNPAATGGRLVLARDRLGKKPLYYADLGGTLVFGSELKAVLQDPRVGRELDPEALIHYLSLFVVPAPLTIFKGVCKLPPGCLLECDARGVRVSRYWTYPDRTQSAPAPEREVVEEIRRLLFEAVEKRLVSEVPLGAFLSGGLDSSTVVAIMSRLLDEPVQTFSVGFQGPRTHDELPFARRAASHCGTNHSEWVVRPSVAELVPEVIRCTDEPFAISSALPLYLLSKEARSHVTVVLTGDGGDEVFGGYEPYLYEQWAGLYRWLPRTVDPVARASLSLLPRRVDGTLGRLRSRATRFLGAARCGAAERRIGWSAGWRDGEKRALLVPEVREAAAGVSTASWLEETAELAGPGDPLSRAMRLDALVWLPEEMLTKVDRMTMGASLEARCPLLDIKLVEFMAGLPAADKVPGRRVRNLKHLLRASVADLLPADLVDRPKHGFNVPLDAWLRSEMRPFAASVLSRDSIHRRGLFDPDAVEALLHAHWSGTTNAGSRIYALVVFEIWAREFLG